MTTKEYIQKYRLDTQNCDKHFDRAALVEDLGKEFIERLENTQITCEGLNVEFNYHKFQIIVKEMDTKIKSISKKKAGFELDALIFSKLYVNYIIPKRAKLFPKEHEEATIARDKRIEKQKALEEKQKALEEKAKGVKKLFKTMFA